MIESRAERLPATRRFRSAWIATAVLSVAALSVATLPGCAAATSKHSGRRAELMQGYDLAVVEYTRALRKNPDDRAARQALDRVKLRGAQEHFTRGRRLAFAGKMDEALVEYQLASEGGRNPSIENDAFVASVTTYF